MGMNERVGEGWIHTPCARGIDRAARNCRLCSHGPHYLFLPRSIFPEPSGPRLLGNGG